MATHVCSKSCGDAADCPPGGNWRCSDVNELGRRCLCEYRSAKETCNGVDDDCNGEVDDLAICPFSKQCIDGSCQCPLSATLCGDDVCYDLQTDPDHCGDCARTCPGGGLPPHAERACKQGSCGWACEPGWGDCDGDPKNGCELELVTKDHCGGCNVSCAAFCAGGQCCDVPKVASSCAGGFCRIPAGCFMMGSKNGKVCPTDNEWFPPPPGVSYGWELQHPVRLTRTFELGEAPVTQGEYEGLMGYNPSHYQSADPADVSGYCGTSTESCGEHPVENLTWHEAAAYCNALSTQAKLPNCYVCTGTKQATRCEEVKAFERGAIYSCPGYRLPTEAEWEYAYRAGTTTDYYNGVDQDLAYCFDLKADPRLTSIMGPPPGWAQVYATYPVRLLQPNAWGLHDMAARHGEWPNDRVAPYPMVTAPDHDPWGALHYLRPFDESFPRGARAALRWGGFPRTLSAHGVRCARTLPSP